VAWKSKLYSLALGDGQGVLATKLNRQQVLSFWVAWFG
jgi:hypothetical protein